MVIGTWASFLMTKCTGGGSIYGQTAISCWQLDRGRRSVLEHAIMKKALGKSVNGCQISNMKAYCK